MVCFCNSIAYSVASKFPPISRNKCIITSERVAYMYLSRKIMKPLISLIGQLSYICNEDIQRLPSMEINMPIAYSHSSFDRHKVITLRQLS